jgi:sialidase-1
MASSISIAMAALAVAMPETMGMAAVDIFTHGESGFLCWRVPSVVLARSSGRLFAFAEARNYSGDGCSIGGVPPSQGARSLGLKTSTDGGTSWSSARIVDWNGLNPSAVYDAVADIVLVHYPCSGFYHPCGEFATSQLKCTPDGLCEGASPLGEFLHSDGSPPLYSKGPLGISAGPGLGTQLGEGGPHAGRLVFSGHHGQADVTWFSDDHGATWKMSATVFGNLTSWGCYRVAGCFDEPFVIALPDGRVQLNMRNDSLTPDPSDPAHKAAPIRHPRSVADSNDGGATFGPWRQQPDLLEPAGGCQGSSLVAATPTSAVVLYSGPSGCCENRTRLAVRRSADGGATYPDELVVWPGLTGYSALANLPDGSVAIAFERGDAEDGGAMGRPRGGTGATCSGGGCRISLARIPHAFVQNGTTAQTV